VLRGLLVVVIPALVVGGALTVPLVASEPRPAGAAEACAGITPPGQVRVAIVVDDGTTAPSARCFALTEGADGADLLRQRADALGLPRPRYASSGLLCAIDGAPAPPACGEVVDGRYRYWAYFQGTGGTWTYGASVNPFTRRLRDGDVEGWRFTLRGTANGSTDQPRVAPDPGILFPAAPRPTDLAPAPPPDAAGEAPDAAAAAPGPGAVASGGDPAPPSTADLPTSAPGPVDGPAGPDDTGPADLAAGRDGQPVPGGPAPGDPQPGDEPPASDLGADPASSSAGLAGPVIGIVVVALVVGAATVRFRSGARR
jgi:hypothetical protein